MSEASGGLGGDQSQPAEASRGQGPALAGHAQPPQVEREEEGGRVERPPCRALAHRPGAEPEEHPVRHRDRDDGDHDASPAEPQAEQKARHEDDPRVDAEERLHVVRQRPRDVPGQRGQNQQTGRNDQRRDHAHPGNDLPICRPSIRPVERGPPGSGILCRRPGASKKGCSLLPGSVRRSRFPGASAPLRPRASSAPEPGRPPGRGPGRDGVKGGDG